MDSVPDRDYSRTLWHGYQLCAPVQQAVPLKSMAVLPLPRQPSKLVCLARQPADDFTGVGAAALQVLPAGIVSLFEHPKSAAHLECYYSSTAAVQQLQQHGVQHGVVALCHGLCTDTPPCKAGFAC
jgi:hypothetical protein